MVILVTYDVSTVDAAGRRRLRKIAQTCQNIGQRVQYSVFECQTTPGRWTEARLKLLSLMHADEDSLRFYYLREQAAEKTEHHGTNRPLDLEGPLVV